MTCNVCGCENASRRPSKRQTLCDSCNAETPRKASRESFNKRYWGAELANVPASTVREFYSDYLSSGLTVDAYIESTTETIY